ncbi:hypothetical protein CSUI_007177, partial [Cystoisospora suis]
FRVSLPSLFYAHSKDIGWRLAWAYALPQWCLMSVAASEWATSHHE